MILLKLLMNMATSWYSSLELSSSLVDDSTTSLLLLALFDLDLTWLLCLSSCLALRATHLLAPTIFGMMALGTLSAALIAA